MSDLVKEVQEMEGMIRLVVYAALLAKVACEFIRSRSQRSQNEVIDV